MKDNLLLIYNITNLLLLIVFPLVLLFKFIKGRLNKDKVIDRFYKPTTKSQILNIIFIFLLFIYYIIVPEIINSDFKVNDLRLFIPAVLFFLYDVYKSATRLEIIIENIPYNRLRQILLNIIEKYNFQYEIDEDTFENVMTIGLIDRKGKIILKETSGLVNSNTIYFRKMKGFCHLDNILLDLEKIYNSEEKVKKHTKTFSAIIAFIFLMFVILTWGWMIVDAIEEIMKIS